MYAHFSETIPNLGYNILRRRDEILKLLSISHHAFIKLFINDSLFYLNEGRANNCPLPLPPSYNFPTDNAIDFPF